MEFSSGSMSSSALGTPEMAAPNSAVTSIGQGQKVAGGFAKLHGEKFVYFMQTYSIILGRNTENNPVDFDLSNYECGSQRVSRCHAHIFYDFQFRHFAIEVIGRTGCTIQGVSYLPGSDPIKLNSQDLIEIAGIKFYFLLPSRSIFATVAAAPGATSLSPQPSSSLNPNDYPRHTNAYDSGNNNRENCSKISNHRQGKLVNQNGSFSREMDISNCYGISNADPVGTLDGCEKDMENQQLLLEEEKDVVTSIAAVVSHLSGPRGWVPTEKLHSELVERFGKDLPHGKVSRYLPQNVMPGSSTEAHGRPWSRLWTLLKKYPEHFVMAKLTRGQEISKFVGLVHLVSVENES